MFDIYDDTDRSLFAVLEREYEIPPTVKSASLDYDSRDSKEIFAYPEGRKYPMDTPEDLYTSYLYFQKTANDLPSYARSTVEDNFKKYAELCGVSLSITKKEASLPFDKNIYALAIPVWDIQDKGIIQKCASMIKQDYLVMYPLDTPENVKLANYYFPASLNGPLEVFRPKVARAIAAKLHPIEYSDSIINYLPVPKTAALDQLEARKTACPELAQKYASLERFLENCSPHNSMKFASELEKLDQQAGFFKHAGIVDASEFRKLIYDDFNQPVTVKVANQDLLWDKVLTAADSISGVVPEWEFASQSPAKFASVVSELPAIIQDHILNKIQNADHDEWVQTHLNRNA